MGIHDGKSALPGRRYSSVLKSTTEVGSLVRTTRCTVPEHDVCLV